MFNRLTFLKLKITAYKGENHPIWQVSYIERGKLNTDTPKRERETA